MQGRGFTSILKNALTTASEGFSFFMFCPAAAALFVPVLLLFSPLFSVFKNTVFYAIV
jgi:hypothetical protein